MKEHSEEFKNQIKELGRQFRSQVTYGNTVLEEELYAVTPHYKGNILKSTMKQLDIETTENIPIMTQVNYKLGMLVEGDYEWLDFGNYIVYSSEKQEDKDTYKLVCYDKLIYSMISYSGVDGDFPMTLREYLNAICTKLGLTFGSNTETFANYDRELPSDRYLGLEDYTYRDVLDEIAQATGSMICLNSDDELVVKYINEGEENYNTIEGTNLVITDADSTKQASITELKGNTTQEGTPTPSSPVEVKTVSGDNNIAVNGKNIIGFIEYSNTNFNTTTYIDISNVMQIKSRYGIATDFQSGTSYMNITLKNAYDNTQIVKFKNLKPNTKYTISCKLTTNITAGYINVFGNTFTYSTISPTVTFTTNSSGEKEINTHLFISGITKTSGLYVDLTDIQLEERQPSNNLHSTSRQ